MKKLIALLLALVLCFSLVGVAAAEPETYEITVWVSETEGVKELTEKQIQEFAEREGIIIIAHVEGISESDSATQMITSVEDGADLYCFAQDQLARLVQAGALAPLGVKASEEVTANNSVGSVAAATVDGQLYCYPLTDDNGYFLFYNKSIIPEEDVGSFEKIIADCEAHGMKFSFQITTSAWYNASFFFATGCVSEWTTDADGNFVSVNDTFNSEAGFIALKGMQKLLKSSAFTASEAGTADFSAAIPSAAVVSGTWDVNTAKEALGENYAVAPLPSFEVDGVTYQLGSFSGCKLMGVKPQTDPKKAAMLQKLALYLTGEKCQAERFAAFGWGPSNKAVQASEAVQSDEALCALAAQNVYAVPQGQIHGSWWNIAKAYAVAAQNATTDEELWAALADYQTAIDGLFSLDTSGYILVGAWNGWSNSDGNYRMVEVDGVYTIGVVVEQSDYMGGRIVTPGNWDTNMGLAQVVSGAELLSPDGGSDNNMVFLAPGSYIVTFDPASMTITVAQN